MIFDWESAWIIIRTWRLCNKDLRTIYLAQTNPDTMSLSTAFGDRKDSESSTSIQKCVKSIIIISIFLCWPRSNTHIKALQAKSSHSINIMINETNLMITERTWLKLAEIELMSHKLPWCVSDIIKSPEWENRTDAVSLPTVGAQSCKTYWYRHPGCQFVDGFMFSLMFLARI